MMWNEENEGAASHHSAPKPSPNVAKGTLNTSAGGTPVPSVAAPRHWEEHECYPLHRMGTQGTMVRCVRCSCESFLAGSEPLPVGRPIQVWTVAGEPLRGCQTLPRSRWIARCSRRGPNWLNHPPSVTVFTLLQSSHKLLFYRERATEPSKEAENQPQTKGGE